MKGDEQEQARVRTLRGRPDWARAAKTVKEITGELRERFQNRHFDWGRDVALWLRRRWCGIKPENLSRLVELRYYGRVETVIKYLEQRRQAAPKLAGSMDRTGGRLHDNE